MVPLVVPAGGSRSTASGMGVPVFAPGCRAGVWGTGGRRVRMGVGVLAHCWVLGQQDRPPVRGAVAPWCRWLFRVGS